MADIADPLAPGTLTRGVVTKTIGDGIDNVADKITGAVEAHGEAVKTSVAEAQAIVSGRVAEILDQLGAHVTNLSTIVQGFTGAVRNIVSLAPSAQSMDAKAQELEDNLVQSTASFVRQWHMVEGAMNQVADETAEVLDAVKVNVINPASMMLEKRVKDNFGLATGLANEVAKSVVRIKDRVLNAATTVTVNRPAELQAVNALLNATEQGVLGMELGFSKAVNGIVDIITHMAGSKASAAAGPYVASYPSWEGWTNFAEQTAEVQRTAATAPGAAINAKCAAVTHQIAALMLAAVDDIRALTE